MPVMVGRRMVRIKMPCTLMADHDSRDSDQVGSLFGSFGVAFMDYGGILSFYR
jgi:hypothetical protein